MNLDSTIKFFSDDLNSQINSFQKKRVNNKKKALFIHVAVTGLAATTTVIIGLQGVEKVELTKNIALIFSALVTLLSSFDAFFNHRALWIRYTETVTQLFAIKSDLEYSLASGRDKLSIEYIDDLHSRYQNILNDTNTWWQKERKTSLPDKKHSKIGNAESKTPKS